ncbi:zinc finger protein 160 [Drosophila pseudoobscura]|uniref:Zinc finger protein 160 n=1 Tax=Drosophila pseudoobscura pseudoobscura TaxID=46245 RepID=A0A6I8UR01_DROPS|nr:zinc finger protein 160 [Drosophila pseudoobscura]
MCSTSVLCPLCAVPSFGSIDALQQRLIKAANGPLACPFSNCKELFLGLDKLTIHLFTHTSLMTESPAATTATTTTAPVTPPAAPTTAATQTPTATTAPKRRGKRSKAKAVEPAPAPPPPPPVPEPPASCDICEFSFRNNELRDMHFRLVHENGDAEEQQGMGPQPEKEPHQEPYKCHLCSKTFRMKGSLRVHLKVVHMMGVPCSSQSGNGSATTNGSNAPSPKLNICDRIRHKEASASGSCPASSSTSSQPYALSGALSMLQQSPASPEATSSTPKVWECDVCTKSFTTKYFLKKHKRLHTGEMPYTCEICARTFTFQQSYHKHLLYHSEVKPHVCGVCGRAFKELSTLHNHQRIHSGEKPFKCEVCGKCFRQRVSFLVHTRIHTGVMPYKCELCQKTFRYKVSQRTHRCLSDNQTPEQLIKAFLEGNESPTQPSPASAEIADINGCGVTDPDQEALLSQTIDDIVVEQCQKLGICGVEPQLAQPVPLDVAGMHFNGSSSPLQQLQNLRLYSPQQMEMPSSDGDIFKRFLMDAT